MEKKIMSSHGEFTIKDVNTDPDDLRINVELDGKFVGEYSDVSVEGFENDEEFLEFMDYMRIN